MEFYDFESGGYIYVDITSIMKQGAGTGIIKGYHDGSLRPYEFVTRAEYAVMLERFIDYLNK